MNAGLRVERAGSIVTLTIDRPARRNAVDIDTIDAIGAAVASIDADADVAAIVLRGAGEHFCAGADVADLAGLLDRSDAEELFQRQVEALGRLRASNCLTVAAVDGAALGFGVALAASCDLVLAGPTARFGLPEIKLGMPPAMVIPVLVHRLSGAATLDLATTGRTVGVAEAATLGLVDRAVDDVTASVAALTEPFGEYGAGAVRASVALARRLAAGEPVDVAAASVAAIRSPRVATLISGGHS